MAAKNIAIFCDGTWQHLDQRDPTNVNRLARCVSPADDAGVPQVVRYDDGVGVGSGVLDQTTHILGGALGKGLEDKVMRAYEFICLNYEPGDRLFIFGFSRGAYTARSLAGLLNIVWILQRGHADKVVEAQEIYHNPLRRQEGAPKLAFDKVVADFRQCYAHPLADAFIHYVGVWDTVGELGVPKAALFSEQINQKYRFFDPSLSSRTRSARHALAIDEVRDTYAPTLWDNIAELNAGAGAAERPYAERPYQQQWFPGHHSGVGGGEADGGLSLAAMGWIAEGAINAGLRFDEATLAHYAGLADPAAPFIEAKWSFGDAVTKQFGGESPRAGPATLDGVSAAARQRWARVADWRGTPALRQVAGLLG